MYLSSPTVVWLWALLASTDFENICRFISPFLKKSYTLMFLKTFFGISAPKNTAHNPSTPQTPNNNCFLRSLWLEISSEYLVSMGANLRETEPFKKLCNVHGFSVNVVNVSPNLVDLFVSLKSWIRKKIIV